MNEFDHSNLTGKQLTLFLTVYDTSSISEAAIQLGLNQSTVSYGIDKLREALGDPLFIKSGRGIVATDRATVLVPTVRSIVEGLDSLNKSEAYDPSVDERPIVIAANVMELLPSLQRMVRKLRTSAPSAEVRLLELGSRDKIRELLDHNLVDAIVSVKPVQLATSLSSETIYRDEIVCFYDKTTRNPISTVQDFIDARHATLDFGGVSPSTIDQLLLDQSLSRNIDMRVPNAFALGALMKGTPLVASMQASLKHSAMKGLAVCPHPLDVPDAVFDLIWHKKNDSNQKNLWLRDIIRSAF